MSEIAEFINIDFSSVFIAVFTILVGIKAIVSLFEWFADKLGLETKWMRKKREDHELLLATANNLKTLSSEHKQDIENIYNDNIIHRDQSREIREELKNSICSIANKLDEMQQKTDLRFEENEKRNNKRVRANLKDRIGQSYRYYHSKGEINDMELEALEDLIEEYEAADGENSFVHSVVQKEMYTWKRVERT